MEKLVIATRRSQLALWQSEYVKAKLLEHFPNMQIELQEFVTKGDKILDVPLAKIGGKGLFTKELEVAMLEGSAHLAVHSLKDVELKVYQTKWEQYFDVKSTDEKKILEAFNKEFKTDIKLEEISAKTVNDDLQKDISMGEEALVQGTPTIFVNGEKDSSRQKYETLGK